MQNMSVWNGITGRFAGKSRSVFQSTTESAKAELREGLMKIRLPKIREENEHEIQFLLSKGQISL